MKIKPCLRTAARCLRGTAKPSPLAFGVRITVLTTALMAFAAPAEEQRREITIQPGEHWWVYADFICRMDRCVKPFQEANHPPVAALNGDQSDRIVRLKALAGEELNFDASASSDPDGDPLIFSWWQYEEAGTYPGRVFIENANAAKAQVFVPTGAGGKQIHIILEVRDQNPIASLRDYRRVVIDLEDRIAEIESSQR